MDFTLGELLRSTWLLLTKRLGLVWAVFFAGAIYFVFFGFLMIFFSAAVISPRMLPMLPADHGHGLGGYPPYGGMGYMGMLWTNHLLGTAMLIFMIMALLVGSYCLGGIMGTVADALSPDGTYSAWSFFRHGLRNYKKSFLFSLLSVALGILVNVVVFLFGLIRPPFLGGAFSGLLGFAIGLAEGCLFFYWIPAVYFGREDALATLATSFRVVFAEGIWKLALGFMVVTFLAGAVIMFLGMLLSLVLLGIPLLLVGMLFLATYAILGPCNAYLASRPGESGLVAAAVGPAETMAGSDDSGSRG